MLTSKQWCKSSGYHSFCTSWTLKCKRYGFTRNDILHQLDKWWRGTLNSMGWEYLYMLTDIHWERRGVWLTGFIEVVGCHAPLDVDLRINSNRSGRNINRTSIIQINRHLIWLFWQLLPILKNIEKIIMIMFDMTLSSNTTRPSLMYDNVTVCRIR